MGWVEGNCPNCGKKIREKCNAWVYGSPIRTCPKCNGEFLDQRWREVAIDGFDSRSADPKFYFIGTIGFFAASIVCWVLLACMIKTSGHYPVKLLGTALLTLMGSIACLVLLIRIILGYEDKQNQIFLEESKQRLENKDYVNKLLEYGYSVPEQYQKDL